MLTELEAWEVLREAWSKAKRVDGVVRAKIGKIHVDCGLCDSVHTLQLFGMISNDVHTSMITRLRNHPKYSLSHYIWPHDPAGAVSRSEFCQDQVNSFKRRRT